MRNGIAKKTTEAKMKMDMGKHLKRYAPAETNLNPHVVFTFAELLFIQPTEDNVTKSDAEAFECWQN